MIRVPLIAAAATIAATQTFAGGIERTSQSVSPLFEDGKYLEFSFASVDPTISGVQAAPVTIPGVGVIPAGASSGDMAPAYWQYGMALKMPINDKIDVAFIVDQPYGADVLYPAMTGYFAGLGTGATASLDSMAYTGLVKYRFSDRFSAYAGVRAQELSATASIPFVGGYSATTTADTGMGYVAGIAYERKELAQRVSLTYNSSIEHNIATTEYSALVPPPPSPGLASTTTVVTPQSINLEFQTGIAEDTLLFGGVRWVEWSKFDISPAHYGALTGGAALVSYADDVFTYNLGVGRRLNDMWSVAASATFEKSNGGFASNLGPTDGKTSVGLGVTYTNSPVKITAGVSYTWIGDADTSVGGALAGSFSGNDALAFGMKVGFSF